MKYIEVVKAVREEQMKKEANVKKLAGIIGMNKKAEEDFRPKFQTKYNTPSVAGFVRGLLKTPYWSFPVKGYGVKGQSQLWTGKQLADAKTNTNLNPSQVIELPRHYPMPDVYLRDLLQEVPNKSWFGNNQRARQEAYREGLKEYAKSLKHMDKNMGSFYDQRLQQYAKPIPALNKLK